MKWAGIGLAVVAASMAQAAAATIIDSDDMLNALPVGGASTLTIGEVTVTGFDNFGLPSQTETNFSINSEGAGFTGSVTGQIGVLAGPANGVDPAEVQAMLFEFAKPQDLGTLSINRLFDGTNSSDNFQEVARIELKRDGLPTTVVELTSQSDTQAEVKVNGVVQPAGGNPPLAMAADVPTDSFGWLLTFGLSPLFDGITEMVLLPGNTSGRASNGSDYKFVSLTGQPTPDPIPVPGAALIFAGGFAVVRFCSRVR
ncbi:MAG: hypothetical protein AAGI89_10185 [Pseudomonadota bacterium]